MATRKHKLSSDTDELFESAVEIVLQAGKASTSYIQRRLRVGYSRAATLLDLLEEHKIVSPQDGTKPRKVLKKKMPNFERVEEKEKARDHHKNELGRGKKAIAEAGIVLEGDFEEEREEDEWDEEIDTVPEGLTRDEERFCRIYVSATEFYGNGTQSYIEAYDVQVVKGTREKLEKGKRKKLTIESVRTMAYRLLTRVDILGRIDQLLEEGGLNDAFIDKQLKHLITQHADPRVQLAAITEYNKLKARIVSNVNNVHSFSNEDMSDEELMERIKKNRAFFKKE